MNSSIQMEMYPIDIRFGVGVGSITTDINPNIAIGADGTAYHNARKAIEYLKQAEKRNKTHVADIRIVMDEDKNPMTTPINTILSLMAVIKRNWTPRQHEIIWDMLKYKEPQEKCAARLGITQSSV